MIFDGRQYSTLDIRVKDGYHFDRSTYLCTEAFDLGELMNVVGNILDVDFVPTGHPPGTDGYSREYLALSDNWRCVLCEKMTAAWVMSCTMKRTTQRSENIFEQISEAMLDRKMISVVDLPL